MSASRYNKAFKKCDRGDERADRAGVWSQAEIDLGLRPREAINGSRTGSGHSERLVQEHTNTLRVCVCASAVTV